jgi:hypothetical protein
VPFPMALLQQQPQGVTAPAQFLADNENIEHKIEDRQRADLYELGRSEEVVQTRGGERHTTPTAIARGPDVMPSPYVVGGRAPDGQRAR